MYLSEHMYRIIQNLNFGALQIFGQAFPSEINRKYSHAAFACVILGMDYIVEVFSLRNVNNHLQDMRVADPFAP